MNSVDSSDFGERDFRLSRSQRSEGRCAATGKSQKRDAETLRAGQGGGCAVWEGKTDNCGLWTGYCSIIEPLLRNKVSSWGVPGDPESEAPEPSPGERCQRYDALK